MSDGLDPDDPDDPDHPAERIERIVAPTELVSRQTRRHRMAECDERLAAGVGVRGHEVDFEGSRLLWWKQRRRLRRNFGIVATRVGPTTWRLRRTE